MLLAFSFCAMAAGLGAAPQKPVPLGERAKGAESVVVATVVDVKAAFERNEFGDQLIVSHTVLRVEESLKGKHKVADLVPFDVEGGKVGDVTMTVSDLQSVAAGDRGVFFLTKSRSGANVPHLRGNGIVKLDVTNRVKGTDVTLDDVKRQVREGVQ